MRVSTGRGTRRRCGTCCCTAPWATCSPVAPPSWRGAGSWPPRGRADPRAMWRRWCAPRRPWRPNRGLRRGFWLPATSLTGTPEGSRQARDRLGRSVRLRRRQGNAVPRANRFRTGSLVRGPGLPGVARRSGGVGGREPPPHPARPSRRKRNSKWRGASRPASCRPMRPDLRMGPLGHQHPLSRGRGRLLRLRHPGRLHLLHDR